MNDHQTIHQVFQQVNRNNEFYYEYLICGYLNTKYIQNIVPLEIIQLLISYTITLLNTPTNDESCPIKIVITNNLFPYYLCRISKMHLWQTVLSNNKYPNIKTIILKYCALQSKGIKLLCPALIHSCPNLQYLDLTGNEIGATGSRAIASLLAIYDDFDSFQVQDTRHIRGQRHSNSCSYIETLILSQNCISNAGVCYIGKALCLTNNLKHLKLENCDIGTNGMVYLRRGIERNSTIISLKLTANRFESVGLREVQSFLIRNSSLIKFDISRNKLGPQGILQIAKALTMNQTIKYLKSNMNRIGSRGAQLLGKMLVNNQSLEQLEISYNEIFYDGLMILGQALETNHGIKKLVVWFNGLENKSLVSFEKSLRKRSKQSFYRNNLLNIITKCSLLPSNVCEIMVDYLPIYMDFEVDVSCNRKISRSWIGSNFMKYEPIDGVRIVCKRGSEMVGACSAFF